MLFKLDNINVSFEDKLIFKKLRFLFNKGDKIGIIGDNGVGKSTLFNIILNNIDYSGELTFENENLGYLSQDEGFVELKLINSRKKEIEKLLLDEIIINNTNKYNKLLEEYNDLFSNLSSQRENKLIDKFNFNQKLYKQEEKNNLSGGESTKLKLIKLFSQDYDYYLLDEPSNHLDITSKEILINELQSNESYIIISHDVDLLNNCCNKIAEIRNNTINIYSGNYDTYLEQKEKEKEDILKVQELHNKQRSKIINEIEKIENRVKGAQNKTKKIIAKSNGILRSDDREMYRIYKADMEKFDTIKNKIVKKRTNELNNLDTPQLNNEDVIKIKYLNFSKPSQIVLKINNLNKKFSDFKLNINDFILYSNEKVALQGNNGCGKSTLLKLIVNEIQPEKGNVELGNKIQLGYLSQKNEILNLNNTILKEILDLKINLDESEIRKYLGKFLFRKNEVFKKIKNLSGGEKIRLGLLKLILQGSNFLILDEPSNHLDIKSKNVLAEALKEFPGPILVVSHDKYFLNKFVNKIIQMNKGVLELIRKNEK
jgi:ATP-binding cassette subfamily F protein 3